MAKIIVMGDLFPTTSNIEYFRNADIKSIFGDKINDLLNNADLRVCNLEGSLCKDGTIAIDKDGPKVRAPIETINGFAAMGIDCVSLANNHATDYGISGYEQTCEALTQHNIAYFGAGRNENTICTSHVVKIEDKTIVFYGVSETVFNIPNENNPGANLYDEYRICKEIEELKTKYDVIIVLYHGGMEYFEYPTKTLIKRFHRMADAGADVITAQHTHCIGAEEYYNNSYLLYGQGNFCFNLNAKINHMNQYGIMLEIDIDENGIRVQKHKVKRTAIGTSYDISQEFESLYERSNSLCKGDSFQSEFDNYAVEKLIPYLQAFRGKNFIDRIIKRIFGDTYYKKYLINRFSKKQLLRILNALRAEEFGELVICGIENIVKNI